MPTPINPIWTESKTIASFDGALAAGVSKEGSIDLNALGFDMVEGLVILVFGGTPDAGADIEINSSPDVGTTKSNIAKQGPVEIEEQASTTKRFPFTIQDVAHAIIKVTNKDSTDSITVSIIYAGRIWTSA